MWYLPLYAKLARAQEPDPQLSGGEIPAEQPQAKILAPSSLDDGFLWVDAGPRTVLDLVDAAVHPIDASVWAAIAGDGSVFVSADAGRRWFEVLAPLGGRGGDNEEAITEVEARLGELAGSVDTPDESLLEDGEISEDELEEEIERAAQDAQDEAQQVIDEVQSEIEAGPWFLPERDGARPLRPRLYFTSTGLLVAARVDGVTLSEDLGSTWHHVLEEPVTSFAEVSGGGFVAGTPSGARWSGTLLDWQPIPALDGRDVRDIVDDGGVWASTETGLWWSSDGRDFVLQSAWFDESFTARRSLVPGEGGALVPGPVLLAASDTIWRATDPALQPASPTGPEPVPVALSIARRPDGLLMAASAEGPFQSLDGGLTWRSLGSGLDDPASTDIEFGGVHVLLCTKGGLKKRVAKTPTPEAVGIPDWVPLGALVSASTSRRELTARSGSRLGRALLPELTFEYINNRVTGDDWNAATWTIREVDTWWSGRVVMTWRPGLSTSSSGFDAELTDDLPLVVFDDEVVLDDGSMTALVGAKVNRGSIAYRDMLAEDISRLYLTRQRIAIEQQWVADEPLYERVLRALQIEEIEAQLDALTEGAVTRWNEGNPGGQP